MLQYDHVNLATSIHQVLNYHFGKSWLRFLVPGDKSGFSLRHCYFRIQYPFCPASLVLSLEEERPAHKGVRLVFVVCYAWATPPRPTTAQPTNITMCHVADYWNACNRESEGERGSETGSAVQEDESPPRPACKSQLLQLSVLRRRGKPRIPCKHLHAKNHAHTVKRSASAALADLIDAQMGG